VCFCFLGGGEDSESWVGVWVWICAVGVVVVTVEDCGATAFGEFWTVGRVCVTNDPAELGVVLVAEDFWVAVLLATEVFVDSLGVVVVVVVVTCAISVVAGDIIWDVETEDNGEVISEFDAVAGDGRDSDVICCVDVVAAVVEIVVVDTSVFSVTTDDVGEVAVCCVVIIVEGTVAWDEV